MGLAVRAGGWGLTTLLLNSGEPRSVHFKVLYDVHLWWNGENGVKPRGQFNAGDDKKRDGRPDRTEAGT